ncbi:MAG: CoA transferase, partial [Burkholderiales bacterium]
MELPLPLAGVRVIELGTVIAGPFAGSLLADLGAEVIKVEPPGKGDVQRAGGHQKNGVGLWWGVASRDKKCITLDLKHPDGKKLFEALLRTADVLVENYRPGVLDRLGFGWNDVHAMNPRLVMLSISGYGRTGPAAARPGFGKIAEALSGIVSLTGSPDDRPLFVGYSLADTSTGMFGVLGVVLALYHRDAQGGDGSHVDAALYEGLLRMLDCQFAVAAHSGRAAERAGT